MRRHRFHGPARDIGKEVPMCPDSTDAGRSKPPASQFYYQDFLGGTALMSNEEVGIYIRLLCLAWDKEGIPDDEVKLARFVGMHVEEFSELWPTIREKWTLRDGDPIGTLISPRMERVRKEQQDYRDRQVEAGKAGAAKRWGNAESDGDPISDPIGNPNGDPNGQEHGQTIALQSPSPSPTSSSTPNSNLQPPQRPARKRPDPSPDAIRLCHLLAQLLVANDVPAWKVKPEGWHDSARLMLTKDGRDPAEAEYLIRWCQQPDNFWRPNVLSIPKFREKYDTIRGQAERDHRTSEHPADQRIRRLHAVVQP